MSDRNGRDLDAGDAVIWGAGTDQDSTFAATATVMEVLGDNRYRIELDLEMEPAEDPDEVVLHDQIRTQLAEDGVETPAQLPAELRARVSAGVSGDPLRAELADFLFAVYTGEQPLEVDGSTLSYLDESPA